MLVTAGSRTGLPMLVTGMYPGIGTGEHPSPYGSVMTWKRQVVLGIRVTSY
jgi:hypothetical protein